MITPPDNQYHYCTTASEYGLFRPDEDPEKGRWLEQEKTLGYYHFKDGVSSYIGKAIMKANDCGRIY